MRAYPVYSVVVVDADALTVLEGLELGADRHAGAGGLVVSLGAGAGCAYAIYSVKAESADALVVHPKLVGRAEAYTFV